MRWIITAGALTLLVLGAMAGLQASNGAVRPLAAYARGAVSAAAESAAITGTDPVDAGRPAYHTFTDRDGLPQNSIMSLAFDPRGFLWASTQDGLVKYNGRSWTVVNVPNRTISNFVRTIHVASDGSLWCGRQDGGLAHLKLDGQWENFDTSSGLPHNRVNALLETTSPGAEPAIWAATHGGGVARFQNGQWTVFDVSSGLPDGLVICLLETDIFGARTLLAGTRAGLARFDGSRWTPVALPDGPQAVQCLLETVSAGGERTLWAGFGVGKLARTLNGSSWTALDVDFGEQITSLIETTARDGSRALWAGTDGRGLWRMERGRWVPFDARTNFPNSTVWSFLATSSPNGTPTLWVGTDGGLVRMQLGRWTSFDTRTGLPANSIYGLMETVDGRGERAMWFGTRGAGIARLANNQWTTYGMSSGLPSETVFALAEVTLADGKREIWAGPGGGTLARFTGTGWQTFVPIPEHPLQGARHIVQTSDAAGAPVIWVMTGGSGQYRYANGRWEWFGKETGLPVNAGFAAVETRTGDGDGSYWIGLQNGGLARYRGGVWNVYTMDNSPLPNNTVLSLCEVSSAGGSRRLWAGTEGGGVAVLTLDTPEPEWTILDDASSTPRLPNNTIYQIRADARGRVYLFTNRGVARLTPDPATSDLARYAVYTYTTEDGLPSSEFNGGASMVDSLGRIWGGTPAGAAVFDPSKEVDDSGAKPLVVEQRLLAGEQRPFTSGVSLAYNESSMAFEYALLSYFREADTRYQTQLVGHDETPTEWTTQYMRSYTKLPDGSYTFKVWAKDYAGNIAGPIEISFEVRPAPWKTWWAFAFYGLVFAGAGYGITRYRLRALERSNKELEGKVARRTAQLAEKMDELRVSEQKALEAKEEALEAREEALEANRAKSIFLSNMSHELRTPLNAVLGFAQLMERDVGRSADDRKNLETIMRSGEHLLELINDVLSISKIEAGKLTINEQSFDLPRLLQGIEEMMRGRAVAKGLQLMFDLAPDLPRYVRGDEGKIRQVIINLLGNAVKFTEQGGVALRVKWEDGIAAFEVEDTGQGIAEDEVGHVFEAFVQSRSGREAKEGTGLGLAITRNFIQMMGGDIRVRSTPGVGTVFSFEVVLPESGISDVPATPRRVRMLAPGQPEYRILIVDDRWENRSLLSKLLASIGFSVREAENGLIAVGIWKDWHPDLIWMDMRMPVMTGLEATEHIRAAEAESDASKRTTIIALTASAFEHEREKVLAGGCDDFVTKPFREATIFDKLAEYLGARYVFDDETAEQASVAAETEENSVTRARFDMLPPKLVGELNEALVMGNVKDAQAVIGRIEEHDASLAAGLRKMVKEYQFDEILDVIDVV